jgi:hypothetical protein
VSLHQLIAPLRIKLCAVSKAFLAAADLKRQQIINSQRKRCEKRHVPCDVSREMEEQLIKPPPTYIENKKP